MFSKKTASLKSFLGWNISKRCDKWLESVVKWYIVIIISQY